MHVNCCGIAIHCLKQALHLPVAVIVGASEERNVDVRANLNPWVILQSLAKNPVDYVIEEGRGESTSLSNAGADLKRH